MNIFFSNNSYEENDEEEDNNSLFHMNSNNIFQNKDELQF